MLQSMDSQRVRHYLATKQPPEKEVTAQTPQKGDLDKKCLCLQDCCGVLQIITISIGPNSFRVIRSEGGH